MKVRIIRKKRKNKRLEVNEALALPTELYACILDHLDLRSDQDVKTILTLMRVARSVKAMAERRLYRSISVDINSKGVFRLIRTWQEREELGSFAQGLSIRMSAGEGQDGTPRAIGRRVAWLISRTPNIKYLGIIFGFPDERTWPDVLDALGRTKLTTLTLPLTYWGNTFDFVHAAARSQPLLTQLITSAFRLPDVKRFEPSDLPNLATVTCNASAVPWIVPNRPIWNLGIVVSKECLPLDVGQTLSCLSLTSRPITNLTIMSMYALEPIASLFDRLSASVPSLEELTCFVRPEAMSAEEVGPLCLGKFGNE